MKNLFALISLVFMLNAATAQNYDFDTRLLSKFSNEELLEMQNESPDELAFWEYFVSKGVVIFTITKDVSESDMGVIVYDGDLKKLNPFALGLEPEETAVRTYQVGDTNQGLMILSRQKILAKMNRNK